jgi:hypothetical protein
VGRLIQFKKIRVREPRRLEPELVAELLSVHASCVHAQENRCPLLVSVKSLTWELNCVANIGNEEDRVLNYSSIDGFLGALATIFHTACPNSVSENRR